MNWTLTFKSTYIHYLVFTYPKAQIFVCFTLRPVVFKIQVHQKSEMHWMTPNWKNLNNFNSRKYPVYTNTYPRSTKFGPFHSMTSSFQDITLFIIPHWLPTLNAQKKKKNCQKSKSWNFANLYTTLVERPSLKVCMNLLECDLLCTFRGDLIWSFHTLHALILYCLCINYSVNLLMYKNEYL